MGFIQSLEGDAQVAFDSIASKVNLSELVSAGSSLVAAWPTLEPLLVELPTEISDAVQRIKLAFSGATIPNADWTALDQEIDSTSSDIQSAGAAAQAQLDANGGN